jgi:ribosome-associated protein
LLSNASTAHDALLSGGLIPRWVLSESGPASETRFRSDKPMNGPSEFEPRALPLRLDQFLKLTGLSQTGGHAKLLIQGGEVLVNGEVETRRRRKVQPGDRVSIGPQHTIVTEQHFESSSAHPPDDEGPSD